MTGGLLGSLSSQQHACQSFCESLGFRGSGFKVLSWACLFCLGFSDLLSELNREPARNISGLYEGHLV